MFMRNDDYFIVMIVVFAMVHAKHNVSRHPLLDGGSSLIMATKKSELAVFHLRLFLK